ncbi:MAG: hypothetical protein V2J20_02940 [Wenzhouxiangella sp.]|nr:hypothetical protein [Wenzhouxiangella sp.]
MEELDINIKSKQPATNSLAWRRILLIGAASGPAALAVLAFAASAFGMDEIEKHPVLQLVLFGAYIAVAIIGAAVMNVVLCKQQRIAHGVLGAFFSLIFSLAFVWSVFWLLGTSFQ